jgi:hypothetical protein
MAAMGCGPGTGTNEWKTVSVGNEAGNRSDDAKKMNGFTANLPAGFKQPADDVEKRVVKEYGSVFVARGGAKPPSTVVFKDAASVAEFQAQAGSSKATIGGTAIELQAPALKALQEAEAEGRQAGLTITPRGSDAAKRSYDDTVTLWASRVNPALDHWSSAGRISAADAQRIRQMSPYEQVSEVLKLEDRGIYFAKDLSKSIISSVAPPGTSQHLSMLALDVSEYENGAVRDLLAKHGWYQTVVSDLPHFTFLGVTQAELPKLGLKKVTSGSRTFWVPDL